MRYMVFDLEFNQKSNVNKGTLKTKKAECPFEIIDIGALKLDENLSTIATFDELIKPVIHRRLHPFIENMTGITRESLRAAKSFNEVYADFSEFISDVDILCVWGTVDMKELIRNIKYHGLDASIVPNKYINVQQYASIILQSPGGTSVGLGNAAKLMNIPLELELHKAFNDAYYTAEVLKKINFENIEPKLYCFTDDVKPNRPVIKRTILDTNKLIAQFEKMYQRNMTLEEQEMIKLAYKMGNTNQFQV
jgi:inhibitor of KinA sporulation pathway (predicted exonuclease)